MRGDGFTVLAAGFLLSGAAWSAGAADAKTVFGPSNPFYSPSALPMQAPPFDKIRDEDYQPAIEAGMEQELREVEAVANDPAPATFENTFLPLEKGGRLLDRANQAFQGVTDANVNPVLQAAKTALAPELAAHKDAIFLNAKLFARVSAVYRNRESAGLDPESKRLVEVTYDLFRHAGANLSAADQQRLKKLNLEESRLADTFSEKLLAADTAAAYSTSSAAALEGLSKEQLSAAAQSARERRAAGYVLALQNTTQQPELGSLNLRATRRTIFENSWNRTERGDANDTRSLIARLAQLRAQRAQLLGFPNHAAWQLEDQMAKTPQAATAFMDKLVPLATARAEREAQDLQAVIDSQHGGFTLEAWDWDFYSAQVRKSKYDLNDDDVKPYLELDSVLQNGVFYAANRLYGITFKERKDIPVYQPDVRVFDVIDADGKPLALFYFDYFKRDNKNGGAWMSTFVNQSKLLGTRPIIYNVANLPEARARGARAHQLRRRHHHVPRIWPWIARDVRGYALCHVVRNRHGAGLRRISVAVQRALGSVSQRFRALCPALQNGRAHAQSIER